MIQLQAINSILESASILDYTSNGITKDYFSDYEVEFSYILDHYNKYGNVPDKESFAESFPNFDFIVVNEPTSYILDGLYKEYTKRGLAKAFNKVRAALNENDVDKALEIFINSTSLTTASTRIDCIDILRDTSRYETYVDKCSNFTNYYVKTGLPELDVLLGGGFDRKEEYATIVARPNVGKSQLLLKMALASAEQGLNVGVYSGEMSETKVGYRIDTLISHISNSKITHGNSDVANEYKKHIDELPNKYTGSLKVLTPVMLKGSATISDLRAFIEKEHLDILFVDQFSLLKDERHGRNAIESTSNLSQDIKNLQVLMKIPIICVSQQNRASTEAGVSTSNVAQSDRISQDSTVLIFIERDKENDLYKISLVKSRDTEAGKSLNYAINWDKQIYQYIPDDSISIPGATGEDLRNEFSDDGEDYF